MNSIAAMKNHFQAKQGVDSPTGPWQTRNLVCQSFNYVMSSGKCELNNRTKDAKPGNFVNDLNSFYVTRILNRGKSSKLNRIIQVDIVSIYFSLQVFYDVTTCLVK